MGFNWRGTWKDGQYRKNDVVRCIGSIWVAARATNQPPTVDGENGWSLMIKGTP